MPWVSPVGMELPGQALVSPFQTEDVVNSLAVDRMGNLYAGGLTHSLGVNNMEKWDGNQWSSLGSRNKRERSIRWPVITWEIYAGGTFTTTGACLNSK